MIIVRCCGEHLSIAWFFKEACRENKNAICIEMDYSLLMKKQLHVFLAFTKLK